MFSRLVTFFIVPTPVPNRLAGARDDEADKNVDPMDSSRIPTHKISEPSLASRPSDICPRSCPTMSTTLTDNVNARVDSTLLATDCRMGMPATSTETKDRHAHFYRTDDAHTHTPLKSLQCLAKQ
jgi:hypothetical protein